MRALIDISFRRPVSVAAVYILVAVLAVVAYVRLPVALLPDLRYPALVVWTGYADVPPEQVERSVTVPVEAAVAGAPGLTRLTSRSQLGGSLVRLDFGWNTNLDLALIDVREEIDELGGMLPDGADRPVVLRLNPSDRPIMLIALTEKRSDVVAVSSLGEGAAEQDLIALKQVGREIIARRLEQLRDVARVRVTGGYEQTIDVLVDAGRLASYGLSVDQVASALEGANVALSGGVIRRGPFRYSVEISGEFQSLADIDATVVSQTGSNVVRLRDVANVREGVQDRRGLVRLDGREALLLLVERSPDANTVRAAEEVRTVLAQLEAELSGVALDVVVDESVFIEQAIGGVTQAVLLGGLLALVVLFVFLRRPQALLAVGIAVPLSVGITLILFDALDVTLNLISLSGLALGVGMLVDNAIVVVENVARLRENGLSPLDAAREGAKEVAGAITASTLTTIAVFLPITFIEGLAGRLFRDQSLAVVCSLVASLLVAVTVVPLLAGRDRGSGGVRNGRLFAGLLARYERTLSGALDRPATVLLGCLIVLGVASALAWGLPREVVPKADQGRVEMGLALAPGASLDLVAARADAVEAQLRAAGLAEHVLADLGERDESRLELEPRPPYSGQLIVILPPDRPVRHALTAAQHVAWPADAAVEMRRVRTQLEELLASEEADLYVDLRGERREDAERVVEALMAQLREDPALVNVRRLHDEQVPAYRLDFRRDNLMRYGITARSVGSFVETVARGREATALRTVNDQVPILVRGRDVTSVDALLSERMPTAQGLLPLRLFVEARAVSLPAALVRSGQAPVVRLTADVAPGAGLAEATSAAERAFTDVLPPSVRASVGGATDDFRAGLNAVGLSLLLSILLVYLILAAQFESLLQPVVILAAVPLAAAGVALVLWLTGQTVNLMSLTGCIVLVGIVVNDAIVKVDFINQRRASGMPLREAIMAAGHDRVRPILMTTITTVLGLLPLALAIGEGSELRAPMAIAIIGGIVSATVLTLVVVPVLYQVTNQSS